MWKGLKISLNSWRRRKESKKSKRKRNTIGILQIMSLRQFLQTVWQKKLLAEQAATTNAAMDTTPQAASQFIVWPLSVQKEYAHPGMGRVRSPMGGAQSQVQGGGLNVLLTLTTVVWEEELVAPIMWALHLALMGMAHNIRTPRAPHGARDVVEHEVHHPHGDMALSLILDKRIPLIGLRIILSFTHTIRGMVNDFHPVITGWDIMILTMSLNLMFPSRITFYLCETWATLIKGYTNHCREWVTKEVLLMDTMVPDVVIVATLTMLTTMDNRIGVFPGPVKERKGW